MADRSEPPQFEKIINFRDVAKSAPGLLKPGMLYRSARLDAATPQDRERMVKDLKIRTIIDLRTPTEHVEAKRKHSDEAASTSFTLADAEHPRRISGLEYKDVNFNGRSYSHSLLKQLTWSQSAKLFSLYAIGYRKEAISVLGINVMAPRGLAGLAEDSLQHCTAEVKAVFDVLSDSKSYPLIVHCTQGKDRTGLIVLLVLLLLGVPPNAIDEDYRLSEKELLPERAEKLDEIRSIGLPDSFADCDPEWTECVTAWIDEQYNGVESYLEHCGVTVEQQNRVRSVMTA